MPSAASSQPLCFTPARELARLIGSREVSAREVMQAHLSQIARLNPTLNALVALLPDATCLARADQADRALARGDAVGPLHGLPIAFKDAEPAAGFPFTNGLLIFKDRVPTEDSVLVERLRRAGVVAIGKTNISEFTMGSHTYSRVYGTTVNPWDPTKSAGGSSGGAAAAVVAGMLPLAAGSALGGSLRNPANFNNVVALSADSRTRADCARAVSPHRVQHQGADRQERGRCDVPAVRDGGGGDPRPAHLAVDPVGVRATAAT